MNVTEKQIISYKVLLYNSKTKTMNEEEFINKCCDLLSENKEYVTKLSDELIKMMKDDGGCSKYIYFYETILNDMLNGVSVSYEEKKQFFILHGSLYKLYKINLL